MASSSYDGVNTGVYGWRKRCLYLLIIIILITLIINMALTVWIIRVLNFSIEGMGPLHVTEEGIHVDGVAEFAKPLHVGTLRASKGSSLKLASDKRVLMQVTSNSTKNSAIRLSDSEISFTCDRFQINGTDGNQLLGISKDKISLDAKSVHILGATNAATFEGKVQTSVVEASGTESLTISSPTKNVEIVGPTGVTIESLGGDVELRAAQEIQMEAPRGSLRMRAERGVYMQGLPVSQPKEASRSHPQVGQLCVCGGSGKLFFAAPGEDCVASASWCDT